MLHILREYRVKKDRIREFEDHHGSDGAWARFFRAGRGYGETTLRRDRDTPGRYLTIDLWDDLDSYEAFSRANAAKYGEIDRRCAEFTEEERRLGSFDAL